MGDNENSRGIDIEYKPLSDKPGENVVENKNDYHKKAESVVEHNKKFLIKYEPMMLKWHNAHKGSNGKSPNPPVYKDKDGKYWWANRKQRKRIAQFEQKERIADEKRRAEKKAKNC